jgi:hypothetical protein
MPVFTDPPPQLPWLLENRQDVENSKNDIIRFCYLSSSKVHTITCPGSGRAWLGGPGCRYLLASYYHFGILERYLLNPLTHDQIHVPFLNIFGSGFLDYIGPDPVEGGDIVVISGLADWIPNPILWPFGDLWLVIGSM